MSIKDGGLAFPSHFNDDIENSGLTRRDWFATFAPMPRKAEINHQGEIDKMRNPHGDSHKPARRSALEIVCDLRYAYADAMIAASKKESR